MRSFKDSGLSTTASFNFAQLSFFCGVLVVLALQALVDLIMHLPRHTAWLRHAWQQRRARRNGATPSPAVMEHAPQNEYKPTQDSSALENELAAMTSSGNDTWAAHHGRDEETGQEGRGVASDGVQRGTVRGRVGALLGRLRSTPSMKVALLSGQEEAPHADVCAALPDAAEERQGYMGYGYCYNVHA